MPSAKITSKGQVTIPGDIRKKLGLKTGDYLEFRLESDNKITVMPAKRNVDEVYGILYRKDQEAFTPEEMDEGVAEYFEKKYKAR